MRGSTREGLPAAPIRGDETRGWMVGANGGNHFGTTITWSAQAQVLVANVLANVARLTRTDLSGVKAILTGVGVELGAKYSLAHKAACGLLGLGAQRVYPMLRELKGRAWRIFAPEAAPPRHCPNDQRPRRLSHRPARVDARSACLRRGRTTRARLRAASVEGFP